MAHNYGKVKPSQKMYQRQIFTEDIALDCVYIKQKCNDVENSPIILQVEVHSKIFVAIWKQAAIISRIGKKSAVGIY